MRLKPEAYATVRRMNRNGASAEEIVAALSPFVAISARSLQQHMAALGTTLRRGRVRRAHLGDETTIDHPERQK
jgi:hypothetical protein